MVINMKLKNSILRATKVWLMAAVALVAVHRLRDGDWNALPADLAWAALVAAIVVGSQRWHAARGAQCAMCVDASDPAARKAGDHV